MMNHSHPYRQKLPHSSSTASPSTSQYHSPQSSTSNLAPSSLSNPPSTSTPYPINEVSEYPSTLDGEALKLNYEPQQGYKGQQLLGENNQFNAKLDKSPNSVNNYGEVTNTPPPVFNNITSPMSNPLSSNSSVTNFNLQPNLDGSFSKSENNLVLSKYNPMHNRSVSSTSSFFEKSDSIDFNQNMLNQYLGDNSNHLMPRIKTIELYRKNAKKSTDPTVLFQYAQYMLQTALLLDKNTSGKNTPNNRSLDNSPNATPSKKTHTKTKSNQSFDLSEITDETSLDDKKLKRSILKEATYYLKKLSDKGYSEAQYLLADAFSSGALGKTENKEAFLLFQSAAKHGHTESAYRTSYCYEEGLGTGRDSRKAIEYLKMAASKNHPAAMYKLGVYSFYGRMGLPHDVTTKKMGIKWLTRASTVSNELIAAAPYELGKIYFEGFKDIVIQDKKYALELYSQAAALGHIESNAILGHHYEVGDVVPQDSNLSIHYYTQAAMGGDPNSMLAMCAWYLVGSEPYLPIDESESFEWAKRAALCDFAKGQFALANFYDKGIGCIKNQQEAQTWYTKAAENGDEKALTRITNKELVTKLQKKFKKKKSVGSLNQQQVAQEKDCIIT